MKENNEDEWISHLVKDLQKVEEMQETEIPEAYQLMHSLTKFKAERKKAYKREMVAFLVTALLILISYSTIAFKMMTVFIWIQGFALLLIPIIFMLEKKRRRKQRNEVTMF
ncbi:YxlC family protein [Metabacillus bambusae]|uniref:YxlC family protein n=1 Tax=Metabacillus bambusae TaxID=2795218 RepID=A0ABS3N3N9_9BACI|nr:YxlC family protein [Metabacillus bambusae]MBO1512650.1 YxlC family protein [Metabacillus bambusae]